MHIISKYNFYIENKEKQFSLIYNALTDVLIDDKIGITDILKNSENDKISIDIIGEKNYEKLVKYGIICADANEQKNIAAQINFKRNNFLFDVDKSEPVSVRFVITPSFKCNFRCFYCYEPLSNRTESEILSNENIELVYQYLISVFEKYKIKQLVFEYFGGEPMLFKDNIKVIQKRVLEICNSYNVKLDAKITSNGVLLTPDIVNECIESGINNFQVTIDGVGKTHDRRRYFPQDPDNNYTKIIENLKNIHKKAAVLIRINVDQSNLDSPKELINELIKEGIWPDNEKIRFELAACVKSTENNINLMDPNYLLIFEEEFRIWRFDKYIENCKNPYKRIPLFFPNQQEQTCHFVHNILSGIMDPKGDLFVCWDCRDDIKYGNIKDLVSNFDTVVETRKQLAKEMYYKVRDELDCLNCKYLPICEPGCPYAYKTIEENRFCGRFRHSLEKQIKLQYELLNKYPEYIYDFNKPIIILD